MDVLFRLRVLLWVLVLGLWGTLAYDFLRTDKAYQPPKLLTLENPFLRPANHNNGETFSAAAAAMPDDVKTSLGPMPTPAPASSEAAKPATEEVSPAPIPLAADVAPAPPESPAQAAADDAAPHHPAYSGVPHEWGGETHAHQHQEVAGSGAPAKAPPGFAAAKTPHFTVFYEGETVPSDFLATVENLHTNVMLDLAAFAPWARSERVTLYVFQTQDAYQNFTGRPAWSGGASSVERRTVYLYKSSELIGILAHELCHVYFDNFFASGRPDPLWLSEGMATYIQIQRGLAAPNWLKPNMDILLDDKGFSVKHLMRLDNLSRASDAEVRLWYTESYSLVRFLIRSKYFVSYYQFCKNLRDGASVTEALNKAYGLPYNTTRSLELAWRFDLHTHTLSNLVMEPTTPDQ